MSHLRIRKCLDILLNLRRSLRWSRRYNTRSRPAGLMQRLAAWQASQQTVYSHALAAIRIFFESTQSKTASSTQRSRWYDLLSRTV